MKESDRSLVNDMTWLKFHYFSEGRGQGGGVEMIASTSDIEKLKRIIK